MDIVYTLQPYSTPLDKDPSQWPKQEDWRIMVNLPYVSERSVAIKKDFESYKHQERSSSYWQRWEKFSSTLDPIPHYKTMCTVYCIACHNCPATYMGQTSRSLSQRLKQHRSALTNSHRWEFVIGPVDDMTGIQCTFCNHQVLGNCRTCIGYLSYHQLDQCEDYS